jgi:hypothetical protein
VGLYGLRGWWPGECRRKGKGLHLLPGGGGLIQANELQHMPIPLINFTSTALFVYKLNLGSQPCLASSGSGHRIVDDSPPVDRTSRARSTPTQGIVVPMLYTN